MSEREQPLSPQEQAVRDAIRALPAVAASPAFAAGLRERFVSGRIAEGAAEPRPIALRPQRSRVLLRLAASLAILVVGAAALLLLNRGPGTRYFASVGEGSLRVDGTSLALSDRAAIDKALHPGALLEIPSEGQLDLEVPDLAVFELAGGTRMSLPASPGRWFARAAACSLQVGELRFRSLPDFAGAQWTVFTPDGEVQITGTLLSVQCDENGTCVCVLEGSVRVGVDEADLETVTPGRRKVMPRGGKPFLDAIKPMHRDGVLDFDERIH